MSPAMARADHTDAAALFGDIVTDLGATFQGGLGMAASGNLHPGRTSMFEPVHGSAPRFAGKNIANPIRRDLVDGAAARDAGREGRSRSHRCRRRASGERKSGNVGCWWHAGDAGGWGFHSAAVPADDGPAACTKTAKPRSHESNYGFVLFEVFVFFVPKGRGLVQRDWGSATVRTDE